MNAEELPLQEQIEIALEIALNAHRGQRDKDGNAVVLHPLAVALKGDNPLEIIAGLLHDMVEDSDFTFDDLLRAGISPRVVDALRLLTHSDDDDYLDYVRRIASSGNALAISVKRNDLEHNLSRGVAGGHQQLVAKHSAAMQIIGRNTGE